LNDLCTGFLLWSWCERKNAGHQRQQKGGAKVS
jgi:hypothetical protein